jgi:DNA (cytosine-5)-methyltransferase 1
MRHGSLFSGIGGFDLAAEWMGWENVFHCEWNSFGQKVLHHYWPNAEQFTDITKSDFTKYANTIDILTGGFPCQPYSSAGKRLGKEDERHLWPEMLRAIREIQPSWVVGENVLGLVNWSGGLVFHEVQTDLEAEGYEVQPYVLPAVSVNAPHRRDRVWFVAYSKSARTRNDIGWLRSVSERCDTWQENELPTPHSNLYGSKQRNCNDENNSSERRLNALGDIDESNGNGDAADTMQIRLQQCENGGEMESGQGEMGREGGEFTNATQKNGEVRYAADPECEGLERQCGKRQRCTEHRTDTGVFVGAKDKFNAADTECSNLGNKWHEQRSMGEENPRQSSRRFKHGIIQNNWDTFPTTEPTIRSGNDGISDRLDSITFPKWRNESIKAGGNAIVPQVVYQIFKTIEHYENLQNL